MSKVILCWRLHPHSILISLEPRDSNILSAEGRGATIVLLVVHIPVKIFFIFFICIMKKKSIGGDGLDQVFFTLQTF